MISIDVDVAWSTPAERHSSFSTPNWYIVTGGDGVKVVVVPFAVVSRFSRTIPVDVRRKVSVTVRSRA